MRCRFLEGRGSVLSPWNSRLLEQHLGHFQHSGSIRCVIRALAILGGENRVPGAQSECGTGGFGHATDPDLFPGFLADQFCKVSALRMAVGEATALSILLSFFMGHHTPGPNKRGNEGGRDGSDGPRSRGP